MNKIGFPLARLALVAMTPALPGLVAAQQADVLPDSTAMSLGAVTVTAKGGAVGDEKRAVVGQHRAD